MLYVHEYEFDIMEMFSNINPMVSNFYGIIYKFLD